MNIALCNDTLTAGLIAFVLGAVLVCGIFWRCTLRIASLSRLSRTAGLAPLKWQPYMRSRVHLTDVRS